MQQQNARAAQKEALGIVRKTYGSTWPGRRSPINRMYLPARAHSKTYVRTYMTVYVVHSASRLFVEQPRIYPLSSAVYTPTLVRRTTLGGPFFSLVHIFSRY